MIDIIHNYFTSESFSKVIKIIETQNWRHLKTMNPNSRDEHQFAFIQEYLKDKDQDFVKNFSNLILSPYLRFKKINSVELLRIRTNLYIKTLPYHQEGGFHIDRSVTDERDFTLLIYLEDSNGATEFKHQGKKIISEKNKAIVFPTSLEHQTIFQTDKLYRYNINVNFKV
tara:strand:- start:565 stop:1074 length:510 start_codon:yes stop_codon:yes gene_type:complete